MMQLIAVFQGFLEEFVLLVGARKLDGIMHGQEQLIIGKGLGQVVKGAVAHGVDGAFYAAERRHDEHRYVRPGFFDALQDFLAGELGHLHVGDDDVDLGFVQVIKRKFRVVEGSDFVPGIFEHGLHDQEVILFVVNDQNPGTVAHGLLPWSASGGRGKLRVISAPPSGALSRRRLPPWDCMMDCTMGRPRPVPWSFVVKKGSPAFFSASGLKPGPVSRKDTRI